MSDDTSVVRSLLVPVSVAQGHSFRAAPSSPQTQKAGGSVAAW